MKAREMTLQDVAQVHQIEMLSFATPWSLAAFQAEMTENKFARYIVLEEQGHILAYGGMWWILDEAHITNVAVLPEKRGIGLGRILVHEMSALCKKGGIQDMTLEVRVSNRVAIHLYQSFGFQIVGRRKEYYTDTKEDAHIMWKHLKDDDGEGYE